MNIAIHNKELTLMKNNNLHTINTSLHDKIILYLFSFDVDNKVSSLLASGEGNKVNIQVEESEDSHKVVDFNVLPSDERKLNAQSFMTQYHQENRNSKVLSVMPLIQI